MLAGFLFFQVYQNLQGFAYKMYVVRHVVTYSNSPILR